MFSSTTILVFVAFNSRFRKLILAASGDSWGAFVLALFLVLVAIDAEAKGVELTRLLLVLVTYTEELPTGAILVADVKVQVEVNATRDDNGGVNTPVEILVAVAGTTERTSMVLLVLWRFDGLLFALVVERARAVLIDEINCEPETTADDTEDDLHVAEWDGTQVLWKNSEHD